ncbi:MAG: peptidase M48 [Firmicutes bacterium HGW-Firmicutes-20]|nr:MAG: peptidase M48 [Firmicutes bacterium HGW-Firmicutes-20]PKM89593.1 MAG: peptidase M48 [Firmicutes bacterium HGW-Firmicutes-10]
MINILTIFIILATFAFDLWLSILNYNHRTQPIPQNVKDIYDTESYTRWLSYTMENFRLGMIAKVLTTVLTVLFLLFGFFPLLNRFSLSISTDPIWSTMIFVGSYMILTSLIDIPFSYIKNFKIEEKYGFNKTTKKTFVLDILKSLIMMIVLGGGVLYVLLSLYLNSANFILYTWLFLVVIMVFVNILYTKVFIRIFNKLTPLPDGELKEKIMEFAKNTQTSIKSISVMDASRRTKKLNAFFSGFGKFKSIVLYDNLIEKLNSDEIVAVLAHEIGHGKHKDTLRNLLLGLVQMGVMLYLLQLFLSWQALSISFGFESVNIGFGLILFSVFLSPVDILLDIPLSAISRWAEYRADGYAKEHGYKDAMITALKRLAQENFANLTPHPLMVKMTYSHPPISQRIQALNK